MSSLKEFEKKLEELYPEIPQKAWNDIHKFYFLEKHSQPSNYPEDFKKSQFKILLDMRKKSPEKAKEEKILNKQYAPAISNEMKKLALTSQLDTIASKIEPANPRIALAIDLISDTIDQRNAAEHIDDIMPIIYSVQIKIKNSTEKLTSFQFVLGPKGLAEKLVLNHLTKKYPKLNVNDIHITLNEAGRILVKS